MLRLRAESKIPLLGLILKRHGINRAFSRFGGREKRWTLQLHVEQVPQLIDDVVSLGINQRSFVDFT